MASLLLRPLSRSVRLALRPSAVTTPLVNAVTQQRFKSNKPVPDGLDKPIDKVAVDPTADPKESYLADPWDILYGTERFELAMKHKGYDDPYDMEPSKRKEVSTRQDPNIIQTLDESRILACVCEADTHHVNYSWIHKGETKQCECGHWFKCVERELPDLSEYGIHIEKGGHH